MPIENMNTISSSSAQAGNRLHYSQMHHPFDVPPNRPGQNHELYLSEQTTVSITDSCALSVIFISHPASRITRAKLGIRMSRVQRPKRIIHVAHFQSFPNQLPLLLLQPRRLGITTNFRPERVSHSAKKRPGESQATGPKKQ